MPLMSQLFVLSALLLLSMRGELPLLLDSPDDAPVPVASATAVPVLLRRGRGRPRKFAVPSRAVTLTLPESVLETLSGIHGDISKAIVQLTQRRVASKAKSLAELSVFGRHAVITVRPTPSLEKRAGVQLVPTADGRALISFDQPRTIPELELTLSDALEDPKLAESDRQVFEAIVTILKEARRSRQVMLHQRNIIVLESLRARRPSGR
jgi:hypothetical protein